MDQIQNENSARPFFRVVFLLLAFMASLSLITVAHAQDDAAALESQVVSGPGLCAIGSQEEATIRSNRVIDARNDKCTSYTGYVQGACGCDPTSGTLTRQGNPVCQEALNAR